MAGDQYDPKEDPANPFRDEIDEWAAKGYKIKFKGKGEKEVVCEIVNSAGKIEAAGTASDAGSAFTEAIKVTKKGVIPHALPKEEDLLDFDFC